MIILGINESHGASVCIAVGGEIVAAVMEERFSRIKNDEGYPYYSIEYCLKETKISPKDIDYVVMASEGLEPASILVKRMCNFSIDDWVKEQSEYWRPILIKNIKPPALLV